MLSRHGRLGCGGPFDAGERKSASPRLLSVLRDGGRAIGYREKAEENRKSRINQKFMTRSIQPFQSLSAVSLVRAS